jgi:uncharacterized protein (UPF0210 family)
MKSRLSRREFAGLVGLAATLPLAGRIRADEPDPEFRIRTITAGLQLQSNFSLEPARAAVAFLNRARAAFVADGYEVQTLRLATQPAQSYLPDRFGAASLQALGVLDGFAADNGVICCIGPALTGDHYHQRFAPWAAELLQQTRNINFSCRVASPAHGLHVGAVRSAAEAMQAISRASPGGEGNFSFAATACVPSGTPFFPAAWFASGNSFSIGLESPRLLTSALQGNPGIHQARRQLKARMESALAPVAARAEALARDTAWQYLGIDTSPAPGLDASIGQAIETLTGQPFGSPSTLTACATITGALKELDVKTCGYSGLMLPTLEDPVLARRAAEGRYGLAELLLYSSVCGTGLDVVPLPGEVSPAELAAVIADVAALAARYRKPLSARLLPIPGKRAGEQVRFDNPHLTTSVVLPLG